MLLYQINYKGIVECKRTLEEAVQFLNKVRGMNGELLAADMIFASYDVQAQLDLAILDRLIQPTGNQDAEIDEGVSEQKKLEKVKISQKVVICSQIDLVSFIAVVKEKGALAFLRKPLELQPLLECCQANGLLSEDR